MSELCEEATVTIGRQGITNSQPPIAARPDLEVDLETMHATDEPEPKAPAIQKLWKAVGEFGHYIEANRPFIPNYGDRYRNGEPISSAPAEATVNQVISKRMVKKQQMRWSDKNTPLLLQLRVKVLNDELRPMFQ